MALYAAHQQHGALRAWAEQHAATSVVKVDRVVSEPKPASAKGAEGGGGGGEGQQPEKGSTFAEESLTSYLCAQPAMQVLVTRFVQVRCAVREIFYIRMRKECLFSSISRFRILTFCALVICLSCIISR